MFHSMLMQYMKNAIVSLVSVLAALNSIHGMPDQQDQLRGKVSFTLEQFQSHIRHK